MVIVNSLYLIQMKVTLSCFFALFLCFHQSFAQKIADEVIETRIEEYKNDLRGPYRDIRWFCKDGSFAMPKEKCNEPGGVQRARYKNEVIQLAKTNHIFLGQILSTTPYADFWDEENAQSRLQQYQIEKYLKSIDNGWISRKAQYYRGAYQVEDEEAWGIAFFNWLLEKEDVLEQHFFLIRQAIKDIPHRGDDNKAMNIRALSKVIADEYAPFMNLRVKIHGQPESSDIGKVKTFQTKHRSNLNADLQTKLQNLIKDMESYYTTIDTKELAKLQKSLPKDSQIAILLDDYRNQLNQQLSGKSLIINTAERLVDIRKYISDIKSKKAKLALLDYSNILEGILLRNVGEWRTETLAEVNEKICYLGLAALGTGWIETWEWEQIAPTLATTNTSSKSLEELYLLLDRSRSLVEWGSSMANAVYSPIVTLFSGFEPKVYGFYDDRIRSSVLLPLGNTVSQLGDFVAQQSKLTNSVLELKNQSSIRGLNPGYAFGELVVVNGTEEIEVVSNKIYVFYTPPSDLKPVAGIMTVSEGNMVSHVQLLARNLGIPNAVLSAPNMEAIKAYAGQNVFYAVSNKGTVIMKHESEMTDTEKALFVKKARKEEKVKVPVSKIDLNQQRILNMRDVNAASSGKICGPKAANLGQLKALFPDLVVEGLVLPFGVFRAHLDQIMSGQTITYWEFLNQTFAKAEQMRKEGETEEVVEKMMFERLEILRNAIKKIELLPSFIADLEQQFKTAFGRKLGEVPVFLRSDTNMEDLKEFTGAGLNLTIFNVVDRNKIIQGIKDVWASPYTERSFKWRQKYLLNPENVFPSILIIPSVDVEHSGVLITKGITTGDPNDMTIAFSKGAGGAVDGQAAESYTLLQNGVNRLISPARESKYRRLPETGGSVMKTTTFDKAIMSKDNLSALRQIADEVKVQMPKVWEESVSAYDVELGFKEDKVWLFQIRPFVENKNALASEYLESITPIIPKQKMIDLNTKISDY